MPPLKVANCPNQELALTNCVFVSPSTLPKLGTETPVYALVRGFVFVARATDLLTEPTPLGLNSIQRKLLGVSVGDEVVVDPFALPDGDDYFISRITIEVDFVRKATVRGVQQVDGGALMDSVLRRFKDHFFTVGQQLAVDFVGTMMHLTVTAVTTAPVASLTTANHAARDAKRGMLNGQSVVVLGKAPGAPLQLTNVDPSRQGANQIIRSDFNFEKMGIGGLNEEFGAIFRRAFASRIFPPAVLKKLGVTHVRGMLLYGPPGTGKTLMARQIGKMLNGREPKVVNGPEILSKYVGQSEENIRKLFADAEREQAERGDESELHIIIFDEIDAICKQRGSRNDSTGVHDTVVNQLLSKIDGVDSLNNILLIGMTNRKDMIDEALLRPGRLEVQVEIHLPDEEGRAQILKIKTASMSSGGYLAKDVDLGELAVRTKNFSGAELEGLVKSATSFAFNRQVKVDNLKDVSLDNLTISRADFELALQEVRPAFGVAGDDLEALTAGGIVDYGNRLRHMRDTAHGFMEQLKVRRGWGSGRGRDGIIYLACPPVQGSERINRMALLLEGPPGAGKTALAAHLALTSEWPFVKLVSPDRYVGMSESAKASAIGKVFEDALRSPLSCVLLDDLERLLEYVRIGPRFSNVLLQTLLVCIKRSPRRGKLFVIATSSNPSVLESLELMDTFNSVLHVRCPSACGAGREGLLIGLVSLQVQNLDATECTTVIKEISGMGDGDMKVVAKSISADGLPIKSLLLALEMATANGSVPSAEAVVRSMHELNG